MADHAVFADGTERGAVEHFRREGWVHVRPTDRAELGARLQRWADEIAAWAEGAGFEDGGWLHYRELTDDGPALCRTENMVPHHDGVRALLC